MAASTCANGGTSHLTRSMKIKATNGGAIGFWKLSSASSSSRWWRMFRWARFYQGDEPIADPAMLSSFLISQAARETLRVMLSGVGGDEVFAGYPRQLAMKIARALDPVPSLLRRPIMNVIAEKLPGGRPGRMTAPLRNAKKFARSAALDVEDRYLGYGTDFTDRMKANLYS